MKLKKYGITIDEIGPWEIYRDFVTSYYPERKFKTYKKFCKKIEDYNEETESAYCLEETKKTLDDHWENLAVFWKNKETLSES